MELDDVITFCQNDLPCISFTAFKDMKEKGELCDLTIKVQNCSFTAHRVILAAAIPYFRTLFNETDIKSAEKEVSIGDLEPQVLESLIDFAYSSRVTITVNNVRSLLQASQFLKLNQVMNACVEFLCQRFSVTTISEVRTFAQSLSNPNLIERCNCFIRQNFVELSKSDSFFNLPHSCVKEIISDDDLNVKKEEMVFEAVVNWVKMSPQERHAVLPDLLSEVRMIYITSDYLIERVDREELIRTSKPCRDMVNEVKNYHLAKNKYLFSSVNTRPRKFNSIKNFVYAVCHDSATDKSSVYCSDFVNETWHNISSKVLNGYVWHVAAVNEKIYVFLKETIHTFHLKTLSWKKLNARHSEIDFTGMLVHGNIIYCFGSNIASPSNRVRRFDTERNDWLDAGYMKTGRWASAASSLGKYIYVTGGCRRDTYLNTVEKYSPSTGQWNEAVPMITARRSHGCVAMNEKIYVCGGITDDGRSCTAEVYDPVINKWNSVCPMKTRKSSLSLVAHNGKIYAYGGFIQDKTDFLGVEVYDPETEEWKGSFRAPEGFRRAVLISVTNVCQD